MMMIVKLYSVRINVLLPTKRPFFSLSQGTFWNVTGGKAQVKTIKQWMVFYLAASVSWSDGCSCWFSVSYWDTKDRRRHRHMIKTHLCCEYMIWLFMAASQTDLRGIKWHLLEGYALAHRCRATTYIRYANRFLKIGGQCFYKPL